MYHPYNSLVRFGMPGYLPCSFLV